MKLKMKHKDNEGKNDNEEKHVTSEYVRLPDSEEQGQVEVAAVQVKVQTSKETDAEDGELQEGLEAVVIEQDNDDVRLSQNEGEQSI